MRKLDSSIVWSSIRDLQELSDGQQQQYHSVEFRKFLSHTFCGKMLKIFHENNALIALYSKMVIEMTQFSTFGANLRKFGLFGVIEEGLDYQNP